MRLIFAAALPIFLIGCSVPQVTPTIDPAKPAKHISASIELLFDTDQDKISAQQISELDLFILSWQHQDIRHVSIEGHADIRATNNYNLDLSARRIASIERHLEGKFSRHPSIVSSAFGEIFGDKKNLSPKHLKQNRRVRVQIWLNDPKGQHCQALSDQNRFLNNGITHLGCSNRANLSNSLARPLPNGSSPSIGTPDPNHAAEAVVRYRTDEVKTSEIQVGE